MQAALADLREAISRPLAPPTLDTGATLHDELARLDRHYKDLPLELDWEEGVQVPRTSSRLPSRCSPRRFRNAHKHARDERERARRPHRRHLRARVRNDGARQGTRGTGMGLRLAAVEALQRGALVEFGPEGGSGGACGSSSR